MTSSWKLPSVTLLQNLHTSGIVCVAIPCSFHPRPIILVTDSRFIGSMMLHPLFRFQRTSREHISKQSESNQAFLRFSFTILPWCLQEIMKPFSLPGKYINEKSWALVRYFWRNLNIRVFSHLNDVLTKFTKICKLNVFDKINGA